MTMNPESQIIRSRASRLMLLAGCGGALFITTFVVLGVLAPNYNSLDNTISSLEFSPFKLLQQANFFAFGALLCVFAMGLRRELRPGFGAVLIPVIQFIDGLGVIGDAIFIRSPLHLICDLIAFNSALCILFLFAWRLRRDARWRGWTAYSILTAIAMMALLFCFGMATHLGGPAGLFEKLATIVRTTWSVLLVCRLLVTARPAFTLDQPAMPRL